MSRDTDLILRKERGTLVPVSALDAERLAAMPDGSEFDAKLRARRSLPQQRMYWAMLTRMREATWLGDRYPTSEHLHDELLHDLGFVTVVHSLDGTPRVIRDSTAFNAMKADEFGIYMTRALARLAEVTGVDPLTVTRETRQAAA
jgi:hypothetical protein